MRHFFNCLTAGQSAALLQEVNFDRPSAPKKSAPALEMRLRELLLSMTMPEQPPAQAALPQPAKPLPGPAAEKLPEDGGIDAVPGNAT